MLLILMTLNTEDSWFACIQFADTKNSWWSASELLHLLYSPGAGATLCGERVLLADL